MCREPDLAQKGAEGRLMTLDYDSDTNDPDMVFDADDLATDTLILENGIQLIIGNGLDFDPGGDITAGELRIVGTLNVGSAVVSAMIPYKNGVLTAFKGKNATSVGYGIYHSSNGFNLGGGSGTSKVYSGKAIASELIPYKNGIITPFRGKTGHGWGIYNSPDGKNLGGGGNTTVIY